MNDEFFLKSPNLPTGKVSTVMLSESCPSILIAALNDFGIKICFLSEDKRLDSRISCHTDVLVCHLGDDFFVVSKRQQELENIGAKCFVSELDYAQEYPLDCHLNAAIIGDCTICRKNITDKNITDKSCYLLNVKQGYAKCSIVPVTDRALITDDKAIADAVRCHGIDTLLIDKGEVACKGYNYGFIGGSCGKLSKNTLAFTGLFQESETIRSVESFLYKYNTKPIYLTNMPIFDVGSIIPIKERLKNY